MSIRGAMRRWRAAAAVLPLLAALVWVPAAAAQPAADSAAAFNGTWEMRVGSIADGGTGNLGELKLWALDDHRLQVEFYGAYASKTGIGRNVNNGDATGIAVFDRGKVTFRFENEEGDCRFAFVLRLRGDEMVVHQSGYPCFGFNVTAEGSYRRVDADRPVFELPMGYPGRW